MPKIGVYGSLRRGMSNHPMLGATVRELLRSVEVPGRLFSLGEYCCIVGHPTERVVGEVYQVSDGAFAIIDAMEREAGYEAREVTAGGHTFLVWYYCGQPGSEAVHVEGGDWVKFTRGSG